MTYHKPAFKNGRGNGSIMPRVWHYELFSTEMEVLASTLQTELHIGTLQCRNLCFHLCILSKKQADKDLS